MLWWYPMLPGMLLRDPLIGTFHRLAQGLDSRMALFNTESEGCVWKSMVFDVFKPVGYFFRKEQ